MSHFASDVAVDNGRQRFGEVELAVHSCRGDFS